MFTLEEKENFHAAYHEKLVSYIKKRSDELSSETCKILFGGPTGKEYLCYTLIVWERDFYREQLMEVVKALDIELEV